MVEALGCSPASQPGTSIRHWANPFAQPGSHFLPHPIRCRFDWQRQEVEASLPSISSKPAEQGMCQGSKGLRTPAARDPYGSEPHPLMVEALQGCPLATRHHSFCCILPLHLLFVALVMFLLGSAFGLLAQQDKITWERFLSGDLSAPSTSCAIPLKAKQGWASARC